MKDVSGKNNHFFGRKHSAETRIKISLAQKGKPSPKKGKKYPHLCKPHPWMLGRIPANKGKKGMQVAWNKGMTKETNPIIKRLAEIPRSQERRQHMRDAVKGSKCWNWQGGKTPLAKIIRHSLEFKDWRETIFKKDNFTCQKCFRRGFEIHPHHIKSFSKILSEFLQEYNQFSPLEDTEILSKIAISYKPFWDSENGITYCKECHKEIHNVWRENALANNF